MVNVNVARPACSRWKYRAPAQAPYLLQRALKATRYSWSCAEGSTTLRQSAMCGERAPPPARRGARPQTQRCTSSLAACGIATDQIFRLYSVPACHFRVKYEQNIAFLKSAAAGKFGVPADKLLLFWQGKELTPAFDSKTLLDLNLHTGGCGHPLWLPEEQQAPKPCTETSPPTHPPLSLQASPSKWVGCDSGRDCSVCGSHSHRVTPPHPPSDPRVCCRATT